MIIHLRLAFACMLFVLCSNSATALTKDEAATCVLTMAEQMQSLPKGNFADYEAFVWKHVNLPAITARAMGRAWKNFPDKQENWQRAALTEIVHDTIGTLRDIQIGDISKVTVKQGTFEGKPYFVVNGVADEIEVNVHVNNDCKVIEAYAGPVRASERIRDRINTQYPSDKNL